MGTVLQFVPKDLKITPKEQWESQLNTDMILCQHRCLGKKPFKCNADEENKKQYVIKKTKPVQIFLVCNSLSCKGCVEKNKQTRSQQQKYHVA